MRIVRFAVLWSVLILWALSQTSIAQYINADVSIYNVDFSGDTYGSEPILSPGGSPPPVLTNFQDVGYNSSTPGFTAEQNHTIGDAAGLTKALIYSNTVNGAAAILGTVNWSDTGFGAPVAPRARLEFDMAMMSRPYGDNGGFRSDWAIVAFKDGDSLPAFVFAYSHHDVADNIIEFENNAGVNIPLGVYTQGVATHVQIDLFYEGTGRMHVYLNGGLAGENIPFRNPMVSFSDKISEFYIQQISATNAVAPNAVALDNFKYTAMIPEPSALVMSSLGVLCLSVMLRRPRTS